MLRTSRINDVYQRWLVLPLTRRLSRAGIGPTEVSLSAVVTAAVAGAAFVVEPAVGGAIYLLSGVLDTLDGAVSRRNGGGTRAGAFLDSMLDRWAEFFVLLGVLGFYARADLVSATLAFVVVVAGFGSWMVSYAQSRAEGLGSSCTFGFFERPERMLVLAVGAMVSPFVDILIALPDFLQTRPVLGAALLVLAVGTSTTAMTRLVRGFRALQGEEKHELVLNHVKTYLETCFPSWDVTHEWDPSHQVAVFRLKERERTMLVELGAELIESSGDLSLVERFEQWDLAEQLRKHLRLQVTSSGLEPLPWKELASKGDPVDEQLRESFPASDPAPPSSVS